MLKVKLKLILVDLGIWKYLQMLRIKIPTKCSSFLSGFSKSESSELHIVQKKQYEDMRVEAIFVEASKVMLKVLTRD